MGAHVDAVLVSLVLLVVVLAGCTDTESDNKVQWSFAVESAHAIDIDCSEYEDEEFCHTVNVTLQNRNDNEGLAVDLTWFEAISGSGARLTRHRPSDSPHSVSLAPGGNATGPVEYEVEPGAKLFKLRYDPPGAGSSEAIIPDYTIRSWTPQVQLTVENVSREDRPCTYSSTAEECHILEVTIQNNRSTEDVMTNTAYWDGITSEGEVHDAERTDGPGTITAGTNATVEVQFEFGRDRTLEEVLYEGPGMPKPARAPVPSY